MKILYIAATVPYDRVAHAGGQTFNYYIKQMASKDYAEVALVAYCLPDEYAKCDVNKYNIKFYPILKNGDFKELIGNLLSINSKVNPFHKFGNIMTRYSSNLLISKLTSLRKEGYSPDVIVMEWTQITIQIESIKKVFPSAIYVSSEHDVSFLGVERQVNIGLNAICNYYQSLRAKNIKKRELRALQKCDLIFTHNYKDDDLLRWSGISLDIRNILVPFYHKSNIKYCRKNNDVIFYGNMKRKENYTAAFWFIDNVMPLLVDKPIRFIVIGGGPTQELKNRESDSVIVTGFVDSIDPWFADAMCFVSPLLLGAGIKVKVIEAMYTGITVLTNNIGIEGIPATSGQDYFHCSTAEEYASTISKLYFNEITDQNLCGKELIERCLSYENSFENYFSVIRNKHLIKKNNC